MNLTLYGKRLLMLTGTFTAADIVRCAKNMGIFVIAVDWYETNAAKELADKSYQISTTDIANLEKIAVDLKVDGIMATGHEAAVEAQIKLCEKLHLPCYATSKQWDALQNKATFKTICKTNNVGTVEDYSLTSEHLALEAERLPYPVLLKPVDNSGSKGLELCNTKEDLLKLYSVSKGFSKTGHVICERFMKCENLSAYYTVQDGYVSMSVLGDWQKYKNKYGMDAITKAIIFPSRYTDRFMNKAHPSIVKMLHSLNVKNGLVNVQLFYDGDEFRVYEACFRLCATQEYNIISKINRINSLEMMIEYAVTGKMSLYSVQTCDDPMIKGKFACNLGIALRQGIIGRIDGEDKLPYIDGLVHICTPYEVGHEIKYEDIGTLRQIYNRYHLIADDETSLYNRIKEIFNTIKISDCFGNDMIIPCLDSNGNFSDY